MARRAATISEGQVGAFLMAVYLNGMSSRETVALALAMRDSGRILDWGPYGLDDRRLVEKHSSGGVGDEKITLIVAPLAAACGVNAPNISARGLDFTAGEVDLLDSIPGYETSPGAERFLEVVRDVGCAIIGPTPDLAPADRKLYYVRDVTATVESVPLITSSIMSKKLASGANGYVICVGSGSGAFMPTLDHARELATAMADVASGAGLPSVMLLTDLDAVLGRSVGNAVAVAEAVDFLTGRAQDPRVLELVHRGHGRDGRDVGPGVPVGRCRAGGGATGGRFRGGTLRADGRCARRSGRLRRGRCALPPGRTGHPGGRARASRLRPGDGRAGDRPCARRDRRRPEAPRRRDRPRRRCHAGGGHRRGRGPGPAALPRPRPRRVGRRPGSRADPSGVPGRRGAGDAQARSSSSGSNATPDHRAHRGSTSRPFRSPGPIGTPPRPQVGRLPDRSGLQRPSDARESAALVDFSTAGLSGRRDLSARRRPR